MQEDDRSTGFLMPIYGTSTVRGQSLSNAFFWAINRSQDATFTVRLVTRRPVRASAGEYRYELGGGNRGNAQFNLLNENAADYQQERRHDRRRRPAAKQFPDARWRPVAGARRAGCTPGRTSTTPRDLAVQQRYQQNILQTNNRTRTIGGNVTGNWRGYVLSATLDQQRQLLRRETASPRPAACRGSRSAVASGRSAGRRSTSA